MLLSMSIAIANLHLIITPPQLLMVTEINELRRKRLEALVEQDGGPRDFCEKRHSDSADKPNNPDYVYQIIKGDRNFGEKAARNMEKRAGLPDGYFDDPEMTPETEIFKENNEVIKHIIKKLQSTPKEHLNMNAARVIEMLIDGGPDLATKTEGIITFVEQKQAEYSSTAASKKNDKAENEH